ncbi:MAG: AMP-binding protein [Miltoncostaeaceae bacterium]
MTRLMTLALDGRRQEWEPLARGMRDALLADARAGSAYWAGAAPEGTPFEEIPPLTKAIMHDRWDDLRMAGVPDELCAPGVTSGSSGEPGRFVIDTRAYGAHLAGLNALHLMCAVPLDVTTSYMTVSQVPETRLAGAAYFSCLDMSPPALSRIVAGWAALERYVLSVSSGAMPALLDALDALGEPGPDPGPLAVIASRDMMTPDLRRRVAETFGCPVHLWYGSREICGFLAGSVATDSASYAFNPLLVHVEVVDDDDRPLPPGEPGRLLLTDLHNRALPMIRYDTGDLGRMAGWSRGAWPVLEALEGRTSEVMYRADGSQMTLSDLGHHLFGVGDQSRWISAFQFLQRRDGTIEMHVVWREDPPAAAVERMAADLRPALGEGTPLRIVPVAALGTLPSGKRWVVRRE